MKSSAPSAGGEPQHPNNNDLAGGGRDRATQQHHCRQHFASDHDLYKKYPIPADSFARCVLFAIAASRRTWT